MCQKPETQNKKTGNHTVPDFYGATDPIRTDDLLITSELLYLLSHSSKWITLPPYSGDFNIIHANDPFVKM